MNNMQPSEQQIDYDPIIYNQLKLTPAIEKRGWLCRKELEIILGCTERTLIRWRQQREQGKDVGIPCFKIMDTYRYPIEEVYKYFEKNYC